MQLRARRCVDGVGHPTFDSHTGLDDATADLSLRVVAACLALGLLSFAPLAVGDAEGSQIRESAPLDAACALLHLDPTALKDALASRTLETMAPGGKTETYQVPLNPTQASLARDALVKSIYSKLFDELVEQARPQRLYERVDGVVTIARRSTSPSTRASRTKMTRSC